MCLSAFLRALMLQPTFSASAFWVSRAFLLRQPGLPALLFGIHWAWVAIRWSS
jgi:hypothetical protein